MLAHRPFASKATSGIEAGIVSVDGEPSVNVKPLDQLFERNDVLFTYGSVETLVENRTWPGTVGDCTISMNCSRAVSIVGPLVVSPMSSVQIRAKIDGKRILHIDTPGIDDTHADRKEADVLVDIVRRLQSCAFMLGLLSILKGNY